MLQIIFSLSNTDNSRAGQSIGDSENHCVVGMKLPVNSGLGPTSDTKIMSGESEHQMQLNIPSAGIEVIR